MSTAVFFTEGLDTITKLLLGQAPAYTPKGRLFTNNHTPVAADVLATFTACVLTGYADATMTASGWTGSSSGGVATYSFPSITFNFAAYGGGTTIYGFIAYDNAGGKALWGFLLDTAYVVPVGGGSLTVALTFQDHAC